MKYPIIKSLAVLIVGAMLLTLIFLLQPSRQEYVV